MVSSGTLTALGGASARSSAEFPPISVSKESPTQRILADEEPEGIFGGRKDHQSTSKPAVALPLVGKTPRTSRESPSASTRASPSASPSTGTRSADEQDRSRNASLASKSGGENARLLSDDVTYKGETCSVHVCGTSLDISPAGGAPLASIPVHNVVSRFEQDGRRVVCSILDWEFFMISSISEDVERIWRLEMSWAQALTFRRHLEKLGIVQTDLASQFKFKKFVGKGAFSEVYLAQHVETKSKVAAKVMKKPLGYPDEEVDAAVWNEFSKEVQTLTMAQGHENVLRMHSTYVFRTSAEQESGPCSLVLITEYLDISLLDLVKKHGMLPETSTRGVAESLLRATAHLNAAGLVHRDIKVSNVMLRSGTRGGLVLVDYGFATRHEGGRREAYRHVVGTVGYLAPELFADDALVDLRHTDVFSIGIVTLTCLRGKSVFQGKLKGGGTSDRAKYYENQACEFDWELPTSRLSPVGLDALKALLEIDPLRRPLSADALLSQWYDQPYEDCVRGAIPDAQERELAHLTTPRGPRRLDRQGSGLDRQGSGGDAPAGNRPLTPTAPAGPGPPSDRPRRSAPGRRHSNSLATPLASACA